MELTYLLEDSALFGGVKVVLAQANAMARRGHRVTVVCRGARPDWISLEAQFREQQDLDPRGLPEADVTVATYWTTIATAARALKGEALHYCQGFEASFTHNRGDHAAIIAAYRQPIPAMVVSPHLAELLEARFRRPARVIPQPLESFWQRHARKAPRSLPRVLVVSPFEIDWKGVATVLAAIRRLRASGMELELVRLSQWPLSAEERRLQEPDEYHCHLRPEQVAALIRSCDLLLAPSWEQEGFGLPVLEAMASGVPVVASDIPSFRFFAAEAAALVPFDDAVAFANAARELLHDPRRWRQAQMAGLEAAKRHTERLSGDAAEDALRWVASGAWRGEIL